MADLRSSSDDSLLPGPDKYTRERVERLLHDDTFVSDPESVQGRPFPFQCQGLEYSFDNGRHHYFTEQEKSTVRENFCHRLWTETSNLESHCTSLDTVFSQFVICNLTYDEPQIIVAEACRLLRRLPSTPVELPDMPSHLNPFYAQDRFENVEDSHSFVWQDLRVVSYVTTNVIRTAFIVAMYGGKSRHMMVNNFINITAELLSTASRLSSTAVCADDKDRWFLVRAFLWTSWQRASMLYFYSIVGGNSELGFDDHDGQSIVLKSFFPVPGVSIQELSTRYASLGKSSYLCGWAFEFLRNEPCAIGYDFRRFHKRFSATFDGLDGRCIPHQQAACAGDEPATCQRFRGMKIKNQSMHDDLCSGDCGGLIWDEASYRSVSGARAVKLLDQCPQSRLTYIQASEQTLAISHVWSHGQGGRPEEYGLNACLHRRYSALARSLGCSSYWMDTPCIPEDHQLRREAILKINEIFEQSRATLVCDRDLMSIDASNLTVEVREVILVTAMICDWNLRAWTFLEAFRGRDNIYVLCKGNAVVSLKETVEVVYQHGSIDIAIFLLTIPHLLPSRVSKGMSDMEGSPFVSGFMTVETAGSLLSHREASRPGDDIVIWSLLLGDRVFNNAEAFWRSREGHIISTSFLVSSAPRLSSKGWSWAPSSPTAHLLERQADGSRYRLQAYDGSESIEGMITQDGFRAQWLMYDFVGGRPGSQTLSTLLRTDMEPVYSKCQMNIRQIRRQYLKDFFWGTLLRPIGTQTLDAPAVQRNNASKTLVVVCATNKRYNCNLKKDRRIFWTWCGVYEWDTTEPLPQFAFVERIFIV